MSRDKVVLPFGTRADPYIDCSADPLLTVQSAKEECDINTIVARFHKGILPNVRESFGFMDVSTLGSYQENMNRVAQVNELFDSLPAEFREKYRNSPALFVEQIMAPENVEDARLLGLAPPAPVVSETPVPTEAPKGAKEGQA